MTESKTVSTKVLAVFWDYDEKEEKGKAIVMEQNLIRIATIRTPFGEKFGIPRQSGLVPSLLSEIHFEGEYKNPDAIRGIEAFSHLWLLWGFTRALQKKPPLMVSPPRLGGKEKRGVFATRSPFRPNSIGLSSVKLEQVKWDEKGNPVLIVSGADLLDQTPIYDIKPYLPYTDCHPEAKGGFGEEHKDDRIEVSFPPELLERLPEELQQTVIEVLAQDPRAAYNKKPEYQYGMNFSGYDIRFTVKEGKLSVVDVLTNDEEFKKIKG